LFAVYFKTLVRGVGRWVGGWGRREGDRYVFSFLAF